MSKAGVWDKWKISLKAENESLHQENGELATHPFPEAPGDIWKEIYFMEPDTQLLFW